MNIDSIFNEFQACWLGYVSDSKWVTYHEDIFLLRDFLNLDGDKRITEIKKIEYEFASHLNLENFVKKALYAGYKECAKVGYENKWYWNLDTIITGEYPFDKIPDYLQEALKRFYK